MRDSRPRPHPWGLVLLTAWLVGCAAPPPVDLQAGSWQRWDGQALWQPADESPSLAGDLIAARDIQGNVFVTLIKPPLPLFTARTHGRTWRLETLHGEVHSGWGSPPGRFIWFHVPGMLAGEPLPSPWRLQRCGDDEWRLSHPGTGERLRLVID